MSSSCTPEEYLARERAAATRSEYHAGEIFALPPAPEQDRIALNVGRALSRQLRWPCVAYGGDKRVRVRAGDFYVYPDVVVVCGAHRFEDAHLDTLLNPTVIIEVLGAGPGDRGRKFESYRGIDSLADYVLVAPDRIHVEHCVRQADGGAWLSSEIDYPGAVLSLAAIRCDLALADIYDGVECRGT